MDEPVRARCDDPAPPELLEGLRQFNRGEFYEQHETLESLWRATRTPDRGLYHGVLQIGVGLHHWSQRNFHGANVLLEEGIERLRPFAPSCHGVDVEALIADASLALARLRELGRERMHEVDVVAVAPRVRFTT